MGIRFTILEKKKHNPSFCMHWASSRLRHWLLLLRVIWFLLSSLALQPLTFSLHLVLLQAETTAGSNDSRSWGSQQKLKCLCLNLVMLSLNPGHFAQIPSANAQLLCQECCHLPSPGILSWWMSPVASGVNEWATSQIICVENSLCIFMAS